MPDKDNMGPGESATTEAALAFVRKLQQEFADTEIDPEVLLPKVEARLKELQAQLGEKEMEKIARRIYKDLLNPPSRLKKGSSPTPPPPVDGRPPAGPDRGERNR